MFIFVVRELQASKELGKAGLFAIIDKPFVVKWFQDNYPDALKRYTMVIIADKDIPYREQAKRTARALYGIAASLKILELPDRNGSQVKDMCDWLEAGGTREELEQLCIKEKEWHPSEQDNMGYLVSMTAVQSENVEWLWYPYLPKSKLTLLEGDPGVGKSWVSLVIASAISLGKGLPCQESSKPAPVLLASAEDGLADTIRPRLNASGANLENIHAIGGPLSFDDEGLRVLNKFIRDLHPALIIIDLLVAYLGAGIDMHRANETRAILSQLSHISEKHAVTILAVRHLAKGGAMRPIYRGLGSIDITAACRSVLLAGCDPENPDKRALVHIKSNLAPAGGALGYEIRDGNFYWTGESCLTAEKILSKGPSGARKTVIDEAMEFLKEELTEGAVEVKKIISDAKAAGIEAKITLRRAKDKLGIKARREGEGGKRGRGRWVWELPDD